MAKRKQPRKITKTTSKRKKRTTSSKLKTINLVLAISIVTLIITTLSYFFLLNDKQTPKQQNSAKITTDKDLINYANKKLDEYFTNDLQKNKYEEYTEEFEKEYIHPKNEVKPQKKEPLPKESEKAKKEIQKDTTEKSVFEKVPNVQKPKPTEPTSINKKPKLAIIIDDVTNKHQIKKILDTNLKITMSLLPPTKNHAQSAKIAEKLPFYMIHFPLQAMSFKFEEQNTLHVGDAYEKIEKRVKQLREWYPDATFTNNHTGSKFTADKIGMDYLIRALKKYNFIFVDSRTTAKTVAKNATKKYNMPYIARNVFIDNKKDFNYIQGQLKKAIKIAKKNGYAIAIGHPYDITINVIAKSKHLYKDLELIYVKNLPCIAN